MSLKSALLYGKIGKRIAAMKATPRGPTVFEFPPMRKGVYFSCFLMGGVLMANFFSGWMCIIARSQTFGRNAAALEAEFGEVHRQAFGENAKLHKLGYPDMGCNIYADILPYKDWYRLNNAQRCHEYGWNHAMLLAPNAFICCLSFPRYTSVVLSLYLGLRLVHIYQYQSHRGVNAAFGTEQFLNMFCMLLVLGSLGSSIALTGIRAPQRLTRLFRRSGSK